MESRTIKRSYIRLAVLEALLFIIAIINPFFHNFLNGWPIVLVLALALVGFYFFLGIEKDRHRYTKDIIFETLIVLLIYFLVYYLVGVLTGFYRNQYFLDIRKFFTLVVPLGLRIILTEFLRYETLVKSEQSKVLIIINAIVFFTLDVTTIISFSDFTSSAYSAFVFLAVYILPALSKNITATIVSLKMGYKPFLIYILVIELYKYLLPIVPDLSPYLYALMMLFLPAIVGIKIFRSLNKVKDKEIDRDYRKRHIARYIFPTILVTVVVYLTCGYFKYSIVAIGSGSMEPNIYKGDMVVIERVEENEIPEIGKVIAYKHSNTIIVHRLVKIVDDNGDLYFYTKGDANTENDAYFIKKDDIMGVVNIRIPYVGIPTVWLSEI